MYTLRKWTVALTKQQNLQPGELRTEINSNDKATRKAEKVHSGGIADCTDEQTGQRDVHLCVTSDVCTRHKEHATRRALLCILTPANCINKP